MSTEKARREAKKREKDRKKREAARRTRGSRKPVGPGSASADLSDALDWPVGDCWVGQDWHVRGARVDALFTRKHADGRVAVVIFELDLADEGVLGVKAANPVTEAQVQGELVRRSNDEQAMVAASPELVVKLVRTAERHGVSRGHALPAGYPQATEIFGDVREDAATEEILTGTDEAPSAPPAREGLLASLKRRLGFGG